MATIETVPGMVLRNRAGVVVHVISGLPDVSSFVNGQVERFAKGYRYDADFWTILHDPRNPTPTPAPTPDPLADLTRRVEALEAAQAADWRETAPKGGICAWIQDNTACAAYVENGVWMSGFSPCYPPAHAVLLVRP